MCLYDCDDDGREGYDDDGDDDDDDDDGDDGGRMEGGGGGGGEEERGAPSLQNEDPTPQDGWEKPAPQG